MGRLFDDLDDLEKDTGLPGEEEPRVLVAVLNDPQALDIARSLGWYRIPVRRAPPRLAAEYLAFYQTAAFGPEQRWRINYYAPVRRYRAVRRIDLLPDQADHPRAQELYFRIDIGSLELLPRPIPSRRLRRITFIPTTLNRLLHADEINDLWLGEQAEEQLWQSLKARDLLAERRVDMEGASEADSIIDFAIYCHQGRIAILCDCEGLDIPVVRESPAAADYSLIAAGWTPLHLAARSMPDWPSEAIAQIERLAQTLGGVADR
ncbi:MAG: hypothetical protein ACOYZ7_06545 [Chloroflexota bacterium]